MSRKLWLALGLTVAFLGTTLSWAEERQGAVVEEVIPLSHDPELDLRPGDILVAWESSLPGEGAPSGAEIHSVFDWSWLEEEKLPRGPLEIARERGGERGTFRWVEGTVVKVRPYLPDDLDETHRRASDLLAAGRPAEAAVLWQSLAEQAQRRGEHPLACWFFLRLTEAWLAEGESDKSERASRLAVAGDIDRRARIHLWRAIGKLHKADLKKAHAAVSQAFELAKADPESPLQTASLESLLGEIERLEGKVDTAIEHLGRAVEAQERLAPDSLALATSLELLAGLEGERGNLSTARSFHERCLKIRQRLIPGSLEVAVSFNNLGVVASIEGHLEEAESYHRRALDIRQRLSPRSLHMASTLNNLGILASLRGDVELSADYFRRALELSQEIAPGKMEHVRGLIHQGIVYGDRKEWRLAINSFEQALKMLEKNFPGVPEIVYVLGNLGIAARALEDYTAAYRYLERVLALKEERSPESLDVAHALSNLATLDLETGALETARKRLEHSLAIQESLAPQSQYFAQSLHNLGMVHLGQGDSAQGIQRLTEALEIQERLAPRSISKAETCHALARALKPSQPEAARRYFERAIDALESQVGKLGATQEFEAGFRQGYRYFYSDLIDLLLEEGLVAEAFLVSERSRARSLLELLAERDLFLEGNIPPELASARRRLAAQYDVVQQQLASLSAKEKEKIDSLLLDLERLRQEHESLVGEIRKTAPRLAELRNPQPLDASEAQRALDSGTAMLSYFVEEHRTLLFILLPGAPLQVREIPWGAEALKADVGLLRRLAIESRPTGGNPARRSALQSVAHRLYARLVRPAEEAVEQSSRLLVIPDGALHTLPWAMLVRSPGESGQVGQYLVEWKPFHTTVSATLFAELRRGRREVQASSMDMTRIAAFGDPLYPASLRSVGALAISEARVRSARERGFEFEPLPATRFEVVGIAGLFSGSTRTFLEGDATEENAKSLPRDTRIAHFAAHATLDERLPLNSAVALTIPEQFVEGRENGLLQAWEIFEKMRLDADLVVLSACESGLGKELGGEGLIGLTRAFQYAGARSVMASLWKISDRTTAELMVRFYRHLKEGLAKDEALRTAQLDLLRSPLRLLNERGEVEAVDASAPYYWAAFQIYGDWR